MKKIILNEKSLSHKITTKYIHIRILQFKTIITRHKLITVYYIILILNTDQY